MSALVIETNSASFAFQFTYLDGILVKEITESKVCNS